jgi:hypothetical protein
MITRRKLIALSVPALILPKRSYANARHGYVQGGLQINLTFDASTSGAPASYFTAAANAAAQLMAIGTHTPATVNITCGYGSVAGIAMSNQNTSQTDLVTFSSLTYTQVLAALNANNKSTSMAALIASLPTGSSLQGQSTGFFVPSAAQRFLGIISNASNPDAFMGVGTAFSSANYVAAFLHEFTECMGRTSVSSPFNFSRFLSAGTRDLAGSTYNGYFSLDGGNTVIADYTTGAEGGDAGDFSSTTGPQNHNDAIATVPTVSSLSAIDIQLCNAIGIQ